VVPVVVAIVVEAGRGPSSRLGFDELLLTSTFSSCSFSEEVVDEV